MRSGSAVLSKIALVFALSATGIHAQKPPSPSPSPPPVTTPGPPTTPSPNPGQPTNPITPDQAMRPMGDLVMFIRGTVATSDGTALPHDVMVERVCNSTVRQQVYAAANGSFSMDLGMRTNMLLDASADGSTRDPTYRDKPSEMGISRTDLANCEVRVSLSGFRSDAVTLVARDSFAGSIDVGSIVVERLAKIEDMTVSAIPYNAPKDARKAYENGIKAQKSGEFSVAQQLFEKAVKIYPKYATAWFQLGNVLQRQNQTAAAKASYTRASTVDSKFLPPYLALSSLAYRARDWNELLKLTGHILELDPLNYSRVKGYILDLDSFDYAEAYFYNSVAYYNLDRVDEAEKSARKAANLDVRPRFPQIHLLLAEIYASKKDTPRAIAEFQIYLDQAPQAANAGQVRERLLSLQAASTTPFPPQTGNQN